MVSKRAAVQTVGRPACTAVGACAIAVGEGSDHKVPFVEGMDIWPDLLHHTNELVADWAKSMRGQTTIIPQVGTTDASQDHANNSISRLLNLRVWSLAEEREMTLRGAALVAGIREVAGALTSRGIYP